MIRKRSILWVMLFTGVVVHMLNYSNLSIAITSMIKLKQDDQKPYVPFCKTNVTISRHEENEHAIISTGEYDWTSDQKSTLMGSFSWFMGVAQLVGALLCQRYGGKLIFGISNVGLGLLNCLIPVASDFGVHVVIVIRALQGIIGGMGIGVAAKTLISKWVPPDERAKFLAIMAGLYFGASFSYFLNGWVLHFLGWRYVFYLTAFITFIWYAFWHLLVHETPRGDPTISSTELIYIEKSIGNALSSKQLPVPWRAILTSVPVFVNTLVGIGTMWTTFTYLLYIPSYLQEIHGLPAYKIGEFSSLPYLLETAFAIGFAMFTDMLLRKKVFSVTNIRKLSTFFSAIVAGIMFGSLIIGGCNTILILALLALGIMFSGASIAGSSANIVDMSPNFCAVIHGLQGVIVMSTGHLSPRLVGYWTGGEHKTTSDWNKVFLFTCAVNILSGLLFFIFGDSNVQPWNYENNNENEKRERKLLKTKQNDCRISLDY